MADLMKLLVDFREAQNLTQEDMAGKLGISVRTYQTIEQTGQVKKVPLMDAIQKLLNTQIVSREPSKKEPSDLKDELIKLLKEKLKDSERIRELEKKIKELEDKKGPVQISIKRVDKKETNNK